MLVIADDAELAAKLSCLFRPPPHHYLPIVDGPRLLRPDADIEVVRRNNAAARAKAKYVAHAGLSPEARARLSGILPASKTVAVDTDDDLRALIGDQESIPTLRWGRNNIGLGLLKALREGRLIEFEDGTSQCDYIPTLTGHMIVCEAGEQLSEVIAANLAFAMGAGLAIVPKLDKTDVDSILEGYYSIYESTDVGASARFEELRDQLRALFRAVPLSGIDSLTFITRDIPAGVAFSEVPNTHLFSYPDLGIQIINGLAAEQPGSRGVNVAVLVDPGATDAPEIVATAESLSAKGIFVRAYRSAGAKVRAISEMLDLFPYDLLLFATHCGDVAGYRWTYEFNDSEGIERTVVVDIALGIGQTEDPEILDVTEYLRFHSVDGVSWDDPHRREKVDAGTALSDLIELRRKTLKPVRQEHIGRVRGSAAMRMYDNNILHISHSLACGGTPIVVNNACVSWHELAPRFLFADARTYIGTLIPITTTEAHDIVCKAISAYAGLPLPDAVWRAQNDAYGESKRRPYVVCGVYTQRLRTRPLDAPSLILKRLLSALDHWRSRAADPDATPRIKRWAKYYEEEVQAMKDRWFKPKSAASETK